MVDGLIGKKVGMTQAFDAAGNAVPLTVILAGPCTVIQRKTKAKDGYDALQMGLVEAKPARKPSKALQGHFLKSGSPVLRVLREFPVKGEAKEGDQVFCDMFEAGQKVHVTGVSKGKGFQGVVKRHHFKGGGGAHGSMFHRAPGSIGASSYPSRVVKGLRMGGRMGADKVTVRNLRIFETDRANNLLMIEGAVPGANGTYVVIVKA
ncbi:MAG: 50S ribosomal protein L3 [Candidatus Aminicenantes bacterium]|nr:50S ribosomal protein L3 [Candidatus Aminicenantes bacterium]